MRAMELQGEHRDLSNKELRGVTARLLWTVLSTTIFVVGGGVGTYYNLQGRIQSNADLIDKQKVVIDNLQGQINDLKLRMNDYDVRFQQIDNRFYNLKSHK